MKAARSAVDTIRAIRDASSGPQLQEQFDVELDVACERQSRGTSAASSAQVEGRRSDAARAIVDAVCRARLQMRRHSARRARDVSNFDFIKAEWPQIHADCVRAEGYLASDPRSACFYARRAAEQLVGLIYDVDAAAGAVQGRPVGPDQRARVPAPRSASGIGQKLNLIRKLGNRAVHDVQPIPPRAAVDVLRELHHVVVWTAFRYSTDPAAVPDRGGVRPDAGRPATRR